MGLEQTIQFYQIKSELVQTASAIFVGTTHTGNWSSHSKRNGTLMLSGNSNYVFNNVHLIEDQDVIDSPFDDRDIAMPASQNVENLTLTFDEVNAKTIQTASGIFIGETDIAGIDSHEKDNHAFGATFGDRNVTSGNLNIQSDEDFIDSIMNDQDYKGMLNVKSR